MWEAEADRLGWDRGLSDYWKLGLAWIDEERLTRRTPLTAIDNGV